MALLGVRPSRAVRQQRGRRVETTPADLHALPVEGGADKKAAESLDGYFRYIEYASRAANHYARALASSARAGVGYLIVRPTYINRALNWQDRAS